MLFNDIRLVLFGAISSCQFLLHDRNELIANCISFLSDRLLDCRCILVSSANKSILILSENILVISLITIMKSKGPITEPWGTPDSTFLNLEYE